MSSSQVHDLKETPDKQELILVNNENGSVEGPFHYFPFREPVGAYLSVVVKVAMFGKDPRLVEW